MAEWHHICWSSLEIWKKNNNAGFTRKLRKLLASQILSTQKQSLGRFCTQWKFMVYSSISSSRGIRNIRGWKSGWAPKARKSRRRGGGFGEEAWPLQNDRLRGLESVVSSASREHFWAWRRTLAALKTSHMATCKGNFPVFSRLINNYVLFESDHAIVEDTISFNVVFRWQAFGSE